MPENPEKTTGKEELPIDVRHNNVQKEENLMMICKYTKQNVEIYQLAIQIEIE